MKIKMLNKHGRNAVQNALFAVLMDTKRKILFNGLFIQFEVDEWQTFLSLMWLAYSKASRQSDGDSMRSRYRVSLSMENGKEYHTDVWYDEEEKCIRYDSLY